MYFIINVTDSKTKINKDIKELTEPDPKYKCCFCGRHEINCIEWGPMYKLNSYVVHYFCMVSNLPLIHHTSCIWREFPRLTVAHNFEQLFSAGLDQSGADEEGILGFLPKDIKKEINRGKRLVISSCFSPQLLSTYFALLTCIRHFF